MKRLLVLLGSVGIAFGVACKNDLMQGNGCASTIPDVVIKAQDNNTYDLPTVTVGTGKRVCWENDGSGTHSVTGLVTQVKGDTVDTLWNIDGQLGPQFIVISTFGAVGDYPYHCRYHEALGMIGVIQVR